MEDAGFHQNPGEWWHYDDPEWRRYPLVEVPLAERERASPPMERHYPQMTQRTQMGRRDMVDGRWLMADGSFRPPH
jgi:hypothetical protein